MKKLGKYIKDLALVIALLVVYVIQLNISFLIVAGGFFVLYLVYAKAYFFVIEQVSRFIRFLFATLLQVVLFIMYYIAVWPLGILKRFSRKKQSTAESTFHHINKEYSLKDLGNPW